MSTTKKMPLAIQILIALILGIAAGFVFMSIGQEQWAVDYVKPFGTIFLNLLKFIVVPIVLTSIIAGIVSMNDIKKVGSIGVKTVAYYLCTTAFAITIGLIIANLFKGSFAVLATTNLEFEAADPVSFMDTVVNVFPKNAIDHFLSANMLQIIVTAILFGFGILLAGEKGKAFANVNESFCEISMKVMDMILALSPIGVFCLITPVIATNGPSVIASLAMVLLTAYIAYALHAVVVYSLAVKAIGGMSPIQFFKGLLPAMTLAFSSASSVGTLPLNLDCCKKMGAKEEVTNFVLPLGATINMDGTAIYQGVCSIFIACCYGIDLTFGQMITIVITATLASIGTAGAPGAGMVMLAMVLQSVGLPIEGIALVAGIDRLFDMGRTVLNITGDASCAMIISNIESKKEGK